MKSKRARTEERWNRGGERKNVEVACCDIYIARWERKRKWARVKEQREGGIESIIRRLNWQRRDEEKVGDSRVKSN